MWTYNYSYNDSLCHSKGFWKKHKYLAKKKIDGVWRYVYNRTKSIDSYSTDDKINSSDRLIQKGVYDSKTNLGLDYARNKYDSEGYDRSLVSVTSRAVNKDWKKEIKLDKYTVDIFTEVIDKNEKGQSFGSLGIGVSKSTNGETSGISKSIDKGKKFISNFFKKK